jgi:hypothetical protein
MTQDEIYEMAHQAGVENEFNYDFRLSLEAFAKLVAAKERDACEALAKEHAAEYKEGGRLYPMLNGSITKTAATACDHIVYIIGERGRT